MDKDSFFSVERLIELGIGMSMARQMVEMFTQTMTPISNAWCNTNGGIAQNQFVQPIYVGVDGKPLGPLREYEIVELFRNNRINKDTLAWVPGMTNWQRIEEIPYILRIIALIPPELPR